ncbi:MAG: hypothetical protein ACI8RD_006914, partial [Bacillariaceae sp.]
SVEKLALRAHIFVGLEFESPLLETYFLVELVVVPGLSLSQPYLYTGMNKLNEEEEEDDDDSDINYIVLTQHQH